MSCETPKDYHERMKVACLGLLVLMVSTACPADTSSVEFPVLGSITKIDVAGRDPNKILWEFTDVQAISRTVAFVDAHRTGWGKPWKDIQTPILRFEFYSGTAFKGTLSAGDDFFEMQRENDLLSQKADFAEISGFLDLLVPAGESAGILDGDFKLLSSVKQLPAGEIRIRGIGRATRRNGGSGAGCQLLRRDRAVVSSFSENDSCRSFRHEVLFALRNGRF